MKRKLIVFGLLFAFAISTLSACGDNSTTDNGESSENTLTVLNYGKYIDEDVIKQFEKETGIDIKYEEYESPEEMYTKYKAGAIDYDVICTSEYIIQKLINEGEVLEQDYSSLSNYDNWILIFCSWRNPMTQRIAILFHISTAQLALYTIPQRLLKKKFLLGTVFGIKTIRMKSS